MTNDKVLWEILVPTIRNNGKPYRTRFHRVWDSQIREISGGLTILTPVKGQWVSSQNALLKERMIPVRVICTTEQFRQILKLTLKYYEQQEICWYCLSSKAGFYNGQEKSSP